jgi:hypothetical protein
MVDYRWWITDGRITDGRTTDDTDYRWWNYRWEILDFDFQIGDKKGVVIRGY